MAACVTYDSSLKGMFVYVNGILNDEEDVKKTTNKIYKIVQEESTYHHNNATTSLDVAAIGASLIGGAYFLSQAFEEKKNEKKEDSEDRFLKGILGVAGIAAGFGLFLNIQNNKDSQACELAKKIRNHFEEDDNLLRPFNLILHSQGADVGLRTLKKLENYKYLEFVRVVNIGGLVAIPNGMCEYVINFKINTDPVPGIIRNTVKIFYESSISGTNKICTIWKDHFNCLDAHKVKTYLGCDEVRVQATSVR